MSLRFQIEPQGVGVEVRLVGPEGGIATDLWPVAATVDLLSGVDLAQRLVAAESAIADGDMLLIEHRVVAGLSVREAASLGLPPQAPVVAHVQTRGMIASASFVADLEWRRPTGQPVLGAQRIGSFLRIGDTWRRLSDVLYHIAEAVDRINQAPGDDQGARIAAVAALREVLPAAVDAGKAETGGLFSAMTIAIADAFSLDLKEDGGTVKLVPILHRAGDTSDEPLLPEDRQHAFGEDQFNRFGTVRSVYTLGGNWYVVLSPVLRRALAEVRRVQSAPLATKRALFASPRAFLRDALGPDVDDIVLESVFRETPSYADRVMGLGLWRPRVIPWIVLTPTNWFGGHDAGGAVRGPADCSPSTPAGIIIGDRGIPLSSEEEDILRVRVEDAVGSGRATVPFEVDGTCVHIPANVETLDALNKLAAARIPKGPGNASEPVPEAPAKTAPEVLLIRPNEESIEVEGTFVPRPALAPSCPPIVATPLKPHQAEGLEWLQKAWLMGRPGVLLADEMGLGKTLQGLAFLAWLRSGMDEGAIPRAPVAVIAPTGLLENWRAEADRHLSGLGLGRCTEAFGRGLTALKRPSPDGHPGLDVEALAAADWVLTTYEALRDYDRDFGQVRFAAMLFDEAQKIKTPGVRLTDAAKAMNADFRVAMTGTPVENRLADLWCITDTVHPAVLGDLKGFSADYERSPDPNLLRRLKSSLDSWHGGRPPLMLRRVKRDRLPDMPEPQEILREMPMPPGQRKAYDEVVTAVRGTDKPDTMQALHRLRAISLHPDPDSAISDEEFIAGSARLQGAFEALDSIAARGESALIFLDDCAMQARLAGIIQRRYKLAAAPMIINGQVAGASRQARVDRFQAGSDTFDAMILSPRAGGVGLTLTRANHVIHLSRWWNPAVEDQCTGRVLRIGQTRPVFIYIPMAVTSPWPSLARGARPSTAI
jgi:superfamily II DNA or RNA helicase